MKTQDILPVIISVLVIIMIAVLEKQSKTIAAITAVMPLTTPLALWIVYSSSGGEQTAMTEFTLGLSSVYCLPSVLSSQPGWPPVPG